METYLYFVGTGYLLIVWLAFFLLRKNRREMLYMSIIGAALGPVGQYFYLQDWWSPQFMYDFPIHIEDLLFGFALVGICSVCYETIFRENERGTRRADIRDSVLFARIVATVGFATFIAVGVILHSLTATIVGATLIIALVLYKRPDFLVPMFAAGALLTVIAIPFYLIPFALNPGWIDAVWLNHNLSGIRFLGVPIEEFIWYFFIGAGLSALWELAHSTRFVRMRA